MATSKFDRPRLLAIGTFATFAPLVFLVTEAIAAFGWSAGSYQYAYNYISDLGTTVCGSFDGRQMCSPLHAVMNFGYVAMSLALAITVILLAPALPRGRRIAARIFAVLVPVGMILVASFPGGVESVPDGTILLHVLGAVLAILSGNILAILIGSSGRKKLGWPTWYGPTSAALGLVGLIGLLLVVVAGSYEHSAVFERISVYAIFAWLFLTAAVAIRATSRPSNLPPRGEA